MPYRADRHLSAGSDCGQGEEGAPTEYHTFDLDLRGGRLRTDGFARETQVQAPSILGRTMLGSVDVGFEAWPIDARSLFRDRSELLTKRGYLSCFRSSILRRRGNF